ncbi:MAG: c-type cytochrome, partial [Alphaproteobacteria bacterium]|nr:c-type cytochrome [Alphaproteobacteria bacterium]
VAFSPDGKRLLSGAHDSSMHLWNVADGALLLTITGHDFAVNSVAFTPDGRQAVSGSVDETVRLWDLENGRELAIWYAHAGPVIGVAISPNGKLVASGGMDKTVRIWHLASGKIVHAMEGHEGPVWSLSFTPDGRLLLSAGADEIVRIWDVEYGIPLGGELTEMIGAGHDEDGSRGARLFRKCRACHTTEIDGANKAGPTLYGVFGRLAGTVEGYPYSDALVGTDIIWTEENIDRLFAEGPDQFTPGSKMPLQRMTEPRDRAELIAYLKRITDSERGN